MATKTYVPKSSAKLVETQYGEMLKLGFKAEDLIAFIQQHKNDRGYINLVVSERREPGQRGDTHSVYLDDWKPTGQRQATPTQSNSYDPPGTPPAGGDEPPF